MTNEKKMEIVSRSPEIQNAVKLMIGLMENIGAKNYVTFDFVLNSPFGSFGDTFTLTLTNRDKIIDESITAKGLDVSALRKKINEIANSREDGAVLKAVGMSDMLSELFPYVEHLEGKVSEWQNIALHHGTNNDLQAETIDNCFDDHDLMKAALEKELSLSTDADTRARVLITLNSLKRK